MKEQCVKSEYHCPKRFCDVCSNRKRSLSAFDTDDCLGRTCRSPVSSFLYRNENKVEMKQLLVFFSVLSVSIVAESRVTYEGFSLFRITPVTKPQLQYLLKLNANTSSGLDFWLRTTTVNHSADVMVFPWARDIYIEELKEKGIPFTVIIKDLGRLIDEDRDAIVDVPEGLEFFSDYQPVEEMYSFMQNLADKYPSIVKLLEIGTSFEGRPLLLLQISSGSENKRAIWIQGGAHAREMVGPAAVLYFAQKLATCYSNAKGTSKLIESFDWYIHPVVNPDGYEYARITDRLWRKTRSLNEDKPECVGADANRNWDFHWSGASGASTNPCSHNYAGVAPFSEPETLAIAEFMKEELIDKLHIFLDFHSYSQRWLTPWGYTSRLPQNYMQQKELAEVATAALEKVYGTKYSVGSSGNIMYTVTGGARDWVHGVIGAPFSYVIELRDKGEKGGFLLPRNQILPSAVESWAAVEAMATKVAQRLPE